MTALLEETYPTELARLLSAPLYSIQRIVEDLGSDGILAIRGSGRGRVKGVSLDPRYFAYTQLKELLLRVAEAEPDLEAAARSRRSRPIRPGREL